MKREIAIFLMFFILILNNKLCAFDNEDTHPKITKNAAYSSELENYLLKKLNLNKGLKTILPSGGNKSILEWLQKGSTDEDSPMCRPQNHFHNPLKSWKDSYMTDEPSLIRLRCYNIGFTPKYSNITWATGYTERGGKIIERTGAYANNKQELGWDYARKYYYSALTVKDKNNRETNFAKTFQALGQVMHLLQDVSVPAHVRNDFTSHLKHNGLIFTWVYQPFEKYVKANPTLIAASSPNLPTFTNPYITDFWDTTNRYDSNVYPSASLTIGLSEFSNANYFSDSTIPTDKPTDEHKFMYPSINNAQYQICEDFIAGSSTIKRKYVSRKGKTGCDHFSAVSELNPISYMNDYNYLNANISKLELVLDDNVHKTYAKDLLPRAIGYSVSLLNYFFRGDFKLSYETSGTPGYVLVNNTGEKMEGDFTIYYDTANDERYPLWAGRGTLEATIGDKTNTFNFIAPGDAKEPGKYIVVFKGKMGNEDGAVGGYVGYVLQRPLEITPPDQFVYSIADADQSDPYFTSIKAKVKNANPSEAIQNGVIQAIAKYKTDIDDVDYIYSMSAPRSINLLSSNHATEFEFNFSNDPIPVDVTDLYLQVIFKGMIGNESNAVAIGLKDISEPTPIDVFNNMDRICINGQWYVTGTQEAYNALPSDAKWWDYWTHDLKDEYIKVSPTTDQSDASPTNFTFKRPLIEAGTLYRRFILSDYEFMHSGYGTMLPNDTTNDTFIHDQAIKKATTRGSGVRNQEEYITDQSVCTKYGLSAPCTVRRTSSFYLFRGAEMWGPGGLIVDGLSYPNFTDPNYIPCKWDDLNQ